MIASLSQPVTSAIGTFSPDGTKLLFSGESVAVVNWAKRTVLERFSLDSPAHGMVFTPTGNRLFVALVNAPTLLVFGPPKEDCLPPPRGLSNLYSGDGTVDDSQGIGTLTADGAMHFAPGLVGQAFRFNGEDTLLDAPANAACTLCMDEWTESLFVNFNFTNREMTILERIGGDPWWTHRLFVTADDRVVLQSGESNHLISSLSSITPGTWNHFSITRNLEHMALYINGELQGQIDVPHAGKDLEALQGGRGRVFFGASQPVRHVLSGLLDEISFYSHTLTADEVLNLSRSRHRANCEP